MSTSNKIFLAAIIFCLAAFASIEHAIELEHLAQQQSTGFTLSDKSPDWTIWNYLFFTFGTCSIGLFIAGIKLRQR